MSRLQHARRALGAKLVDSFFRHTSRVARLHPLARPERHGVEVVRDVSYGPRAEMRLDVWRPGRAAEPMPVVLYVHGGGFRILSKDSHWVMALSFARRGYLVFNVDYRLAPQHPFPAALEDCAEAYAWVVENAARFGGDASRLVLAGESAGANLVTSMAIGATHRRPEAFAQRIFETGVVPRAVLPACGMFQVTDVERFGRRRRMPAWLMDRLHEVSDAYLRGSTAPSTELADPLVVFERGDAAARPIPPFFLPCGTADPLLDDTRRLGAALAAQGVRADVALYPGEPHAFHAFVFRESARRCWGDTFRFLADVLGPDAPAR